VSDRVERSCNLGSAHCVLPILGSGPDDLEVHDLTSVGQMLVVRRDHALARKRRVSVPELAGERFVLPPLGKPHRAILDAAFRIHDTRVVLGATASGWELTLKLVELGFGIAIVNGCCRVTRGLVARPLRALPTVHYAVLPVRNRARRLPSSCAFSCRRGSHGEGLEHRRHHRVDDPGDACREQARLVRLQP
jgi:hypothetical protein